MRVAPHEYVVARGWSRTLIRIRNGAVSLERPAIAGYTALRHIEGIGTVLGSGNIGTVHVYDEGTWKELETIRGGMNAIKSFHPFLDGFLIGGINGWLGQYLATYDLFCPLEVVTANSSDHLAEAGGVVFSGGSARDGKVLVTLLQR